MLKSLQEVVHLFEMAQTSVFKLMSSVSASPVPSIHLTRQDSVPKFMRDPKYTAILQEHDVDLIGASRAYSPTLPERSMSRSAR